MLRRQLGYPIVYNGLVSAPFLFLVFSRGLAAYATKRPTRQQSPGVFNIVGSLKIFAPATCNVHIALMVPVHRAGSHLASQAFKPWTNLYIRPKESRQAGSRTIITTTKPWSLDCLSQEFARQYGTHGRCLCSGYFFATRSPAQDIADGSAPTLKPWHLSVATPFFAPCLNMHPGDLCVMSIRRWEANSNHSSPARLELRNGLLSWVSLGNLGSAVECGAEVYPPYAGMQRLDICDRDKKEERGRWG